MAISLVKSLPAFFTKIGIDSLTKDLETHVLFGAFMGKRLVGFISLRKADIGSLEISWLAVGKKFQGLGIGSKLVRESLKKFTKDGFKICYVKTLAKTVKDEGYTQTRMFYKKLGFYTLEIINPYPSWIEGNPCQILAAALPLS